MKRLAYEGRKCLFEHSKWTHSIIIERMDSPLKFELLIT